MPPLSGRLPIAVCLVCVTLTAAWLPPLQAQDKPAGIAGTWQGALDLGIARLRLVVEFKEKDGGGYSGTMDSPDQNAFGMAIDEVTVSDGAVKFTMKAIGGSYEGTLADDGSQIDGKWSQGGRSLALVLKPGEKIAPPKRPQEPKPPLPYAEEEVRYENKEAGITIAGTLTRPKEGGPFPAVLLISGSGPQDRNEEVAGHKPFLIWADHLTRRGMAVLRVDDRGVGGTGGKPLESTIEDHVGDALAGVAYLQSRGDIDAKKIGLMGHSEGGLVAPAAAARSPDVAFIVLLAGTGVVGEQILYSQGELIGQAAGSSPKTLALNRRLQEKIFAVLKQQADDATLAAKMSEAIAEFKSDLTEQQQEALDANAGLAEQQVKMVLSPWFRHFLTYDPRPALAKVKCPVLAVCGEKDLQVDPKLNLPAIEAALKAAGNRDYTVQELPGLNHLFQASATGALAEYQEIEETINPAALEVVAQWLMERTGPDMPR